MGIRSLRVATIYYSREGGRKGMLVTSSTRKQTRRVDDIITLKNKYVDSSSNKKRTITAQDISFERTVSNEDS
jgi:hypothetical protein